MYLQHQRFQERGKGGGVISSATCAIFTFAIFAESPRRSAADAGGLGVQAPRPARPALPDPTPTQLVQNQPVNINRTQLGVLRLHILPKGESNLVEIWGRAKCLG